MTVREASARAAFLAVGLGILAYCIAEESIGLALVAAPLWALSWPAAQGPRGRPAPRVLIFVLTLAATAHVAATVARRPEDLVSGISRYLVWLLLIKLYDRASARDRGQLLSMSVFLAMGACLTSNTLWLGLALAAYLPLMLIAAMLRQQEGAAERAAEARAALRPTDQRRLEAHSAPARGWRRDLAGVALVCMALGLMIAGAVFVLTPRRVGLGWMGAWSPPPVGRVVGFDDEVRLGGEGLISDSSTAVFDLRVTDGDGQDVGDRHERMLLRGAVLEDYDAATGRWRRGQRGPGQMPPPSSLMGGQTEPISRGVRDADTIVQRVSFRNKAPGPMFAMFRPLTFAPDTFVGFSKDPRTLTLDFDATGRVSYTAVSQPDAPPPAQRGADPARLTARLAPLFGEGRIKDETVRVLAEAGVSRDAEPRFTPDDGRIATLIQDHLRGRCAYTTELVAPGAGMEPIESFLFESRRGHCEYFASAMAAMCRSVGIDARVVTGYVASERAEDGAFIVRQSHAHAWTEVATAPGHWRTFDPSPPDDVALSHAPRRGFTARLRSALESLERLWIDMVVAYDDQRRLAIVGGPAPAGEAAPQRSQGSAASGRAERGWAGALGRIAKGAGGLAVAVGVGYAALRLGAGAAAWIARRRGERRALADDPSLAERMKRASFFGEYQRALRRAGAAGALWETPLSGAQRLRPVSAPLAEAAERLVGLYYEARYGRRALSDVEVAEAEALVEDVRRELGGLRRPDGEMRAAPGPEQRRRERRESRTTW